MDQSTGRDAGPAHQIMRGMGLVAVTVARSGGSDGHGFSIQCAQQRLQAAHTSVLLRGHAHRRQKTQLQATQGHAKPPCQFGDAQSAFRCIQFRNGQFDALVQGEAGTTIPQHLPEGLGRTAGGACPRGGAEGLGKEGIQRVQVRRLVAKPGQADAGNQGARGRLHAHADTENRADSLQTNRAALLCGEAERQIGADPAICPMKMQWHAQLRQQLAAAIGIDDLHVMARGFVPQPPEALDMTAQVVGGRVLAVVHAASDAILRIFTSALGGPAASLQPTHPGGQYMLKSKVAVLGAGLVLGSGAAMAAPAEFDWLAGHWCGGTEERSLDEVWLPEAGGALLGMSRTLSHGEMESFEYMRLVPAGKAAGLHVQPNGVAPTTFVIADHGANWVVFENPQNDFPTRIEYRRDGTVLKASISGPGDDGKILRIPFDYQRCGD